MLTDPRKDVLALADSPQLDSLLARARTKAAEAAPVSATQLPDQSKVEKAAADAQKLATDLAGTLQQTADEGTTSRTQKVAMVRHMLEVGVRVLE